MADRRVQHPALNDRSATHVFVAAIGTTAFLRSSASGRMQNVRQLCGSLPALGHKRTNRLGSKSDFIRFGPKADIRGAKSHVRFTPESGH